MTPERRYSDRDSSHTRLPAAALHQPHFGNATRDSDCPPTTRRPPHEPEDAAETAR